MADASQIEWTDATWNPVTGCTKISPGCDRCYERIARELDSAPSLELTTLHGCLRADVAVYRDAKPFALIEIKKFEHHGGLTKIRDDLNKLRRATEGRRLEIYLAVLISQTPHSTVETLTLALTAALGGAFDAFGLQTVANDGQADWRWQFACGSFAPEP